MYCCYLSLAFFLGFGTKRVLALTSLDIIVDPLGRSPDNTLVVTTLHEAASRLAELPTVSGAFCGERRRRVLLATDVPHVLTEPLELDERHSCSTWQALPTNDNTDDDESKMYVKIRGGVKIPVQAFRHYYLPGDDKRKSPRHKIWVASLDDVQPHMDLGTLTKLDPLKLNCQHRRAADVYWNGQPMTLARHPNILRRRRRRRRGDQHNNVWQWFILPNVTASNQFLRDNEDDFAVMLQEFRDAGGEDDNDIWLHGYFGVDWADIHLQLASLDQDTYTFDNVTTPNHYGLVPNARYSVINSLAALDAPGEYYLDHQRRLLYVFPPLGVLDVEADIVVATTETLLQVTNATDIDLKDIHWSFARGTALQLDNVTGMHLMHGSVQNAGGDWAIEMLNAQQSVVHKMHLRNLQCGGLFVQGGDRFTLEPAHIFVDDCVVEHNSLWKRTYTPGIYFLGVGLHFSRNRLAYAPHAGIIGHGNDCLFEYNYLHDMCFETTDAGAFYGGRSWADRGIVLRHNVFERIRRTEPNATLGFPHVAAVYLDDFMSGYHIYNTTVIDSDHGFLLGGGRDNLFVNTTMIRVDVPIHMDKRGLNWAAPACQPNGTLDLELQSFDYKEGAWAVRWPDLATLMEDHPCAPTHNRIHNLTFCHEFLNQTAWLTTPSTDISELLLWDNSFSLVRQEMHFCQANRNDPGQVSETDFATK